MNADELRIIPRTDGGTPIEGTVEHRPDGSRVYRHTIPSGELETTLTTDGTVTVFLGDKLLLDVGPPILLEVEEND